jgi:hypothetical protein
MQVSNIETERLIILVHGTFAKNAPWINETSSFSNGLKKFLGNKTKIVPFNWSGKNSYFERVAAGNQLSILLEETFKSHPNSQKIVIGHSHGGNVICYALKQIPEIASEFKIITLATPFLISSLRADTNTRYIIGVFRGQVMPYALFVISFLIVLIVTFLIAHWLYQIWEPLFLLGLFPMGAIGTLYEFFIEGIAVDEVNAEVPRHAKETLDKIDTTLTGKINLLAIIYKKDEAKSLLSFSNSVTGITSQGFGYINSIARRVTKIFLFIFFFSLLSLLVLAFFEGFFGVKTGFLTNWIDDFWLICIIFWFCYLVIYVFVTCIFYLFSANPLFFGWKSWHQFLYIKTVPSAFPDNVVNPSFIEFVVRKKSPGKLRHSQIYEDKNIHEIICNWISGKLIVHTALRIKLKE